MAVLQRLAQNLQRAAFELGQLVEEEHAVVREGDFAGAGNRAATEQADVGDGVVRRAHGATAENGGAGECLPGGGVDAENLQRLVEGGGGEDAREAFRHHGFPCAGRADHDEVVAAGGRDLDGTAERMLTFDLGEITGAGVGRGGGGEGLGVRDGREENFAGEKTCRLIE